ncbi:H/ACA ribonucleoprotein complex non-core subunit NAF1 [Vespa velutina]|uniref:H/ACA ribonucleoprotein complex non-core subunit NAF1 n=1 Tax=Vespa velutina TaxID=202808 RepID=UPI001FB4948F|nr:H/ACA ribonucleoprotein complex non-core subunit NAF1 [Vespa velutina]
MSDISEKSHKTTSETENGEVYIIYDSTMPETNENKLVPIFNCAYSDITDDSNDSKNILIETVEPNNSTDTNVSYPLNNEVYEIHDSTVELTKENKYQKIMHSDKVITNNNIECTATKATDKDNVEEMTIEAITNDIIEHIPVETIIEETNNFDTHNSSMHKDDMISHKISVSNKTTSSLSAIAVEYDSDVDTEDGICTNTNKSLDLNKNQNNENIEILCCENTNVYRVKNEELSNKDSDSDSNSDSDDSSNSSDSSVIVIPNDSDENSDNETKRNKIKDKRQSNERELKSELDDLPPIEDLKISVSENSCDLVGEVAWMVEQLVVVRPKAGKPTLNLDTVLFIDKGKRALGRVFDVFGRVSDPHYCVRFNSPAHIKENEINIGMAVYYCPNSPYTSIVFLHELTKMKGTDAVDDDEAPDFSDDEEERKYYENLKQKKVNEIISSEDNIPHKRRRKSTSSWQSNHPWNRNIGQNFKGRKSQVRNNDSSGTSNSYSSPWTSFPYFNNLNYPTNFQQMHSTHSGLYGYMPYSNNLPTSNTNQNSNKYNISPQCINVNRNEPSIPNPKISFGMLPRFQSATSANVNRHNTFPAPNLRFPRTDMYWQSQTSYVTSPLSFLPPPPPPPPPSSMIQMFDEQNHDTSQ